MRKRSEIEGGGSNEEGNERDKSGILMRERENKRGQRIELLGRGKT